MNTPVTDVEVRSLIGRVEMGQAEEEEIVEFLQRLIPPRPVQVQSSMEDKVAKFWKEFEEGTLFENISGQTWEEAEKIAEAIKVRDPNHWLFQGPKGNTHTKSPQETYEAALADYIERYGVVEKVTFTDGWNACIASLKSQSVEYRCCNSWFVALHEKRQAVLIDDKWMLAHNAFDAGRVLGRFEAFQSAEIKS